MEWDCTQCGRCCKRWNISIDLEDIENIKKCGYDEREFADNILGEAKLLRDSKKLRFLRRKGQLFLKHRGSNCVFLTEDNKCRIQLEHGYKFKPKVCRQFPFDKNNANTFVCGNVVKIGFKEKTPFIDKGKILKKRSFLESRRSEASPKIFQYGSKIISPELLLYAISKADAENCANSWHAILKGIKASKNRIIEENDIDGALKNPKKMSKLQNLRLKIILAGYSRFFYPELALLISRKFKIPLKFACEKIGINFKHIKSVEIKSSDRQKFLNLLKKGYGIIYKPDYPDHLLFCLFFLDDFSRQIAYNNKKDKADILDILNAFSLLNSTIRFS